MRKGFFEETWKGVLLVVYIFMPCTFLMSLAVHYIMTNISNDWQIQNALVMVFIMEGSFLVIYPCNYAHLVKKEKIRFSFFSFIIGLFPIVACIIGEILLWIYMN